MDETQQPASDPGWPAVPQQPAADRAAAEVEGALTEPGPAASAAPAVEPVASDQREGWPSRFFLMRQKLAAAQEEAFGGSAARRAAFEEATATREAAEVLLVHTPGAREAACSLLRDGLFSAARAVLPDPPQTPAEAWAGLSLPGAGRLDPFTDAERASLERAFVGTGDEQTPSDSEARLAVLRLGLDVVLASSQ